MKRVMILAALLSIPTLAGAQVSEEWSTYCDNGVEKVRVSITYHFEGGLYTFHSAQLAAYSGDGCNAVIDCGGSHDAACESLGDGVFRVTLKGFQRECFTEANVARQGQIVFRLDSPEDGTYTYSLIDLFCDDYGTRTLTDNIECSPLPVTPATWGAVKAMYR